MKLLIAICFFMKVCNILCVSQQDLIAFNKWKSMFKVEFCNPKESDRALQNFLDNKQVIDAHNEQFKKNCSVGFAMSLWENSGYTASEVSKMLNGLFDDGEGDDTVLGKSLSIGGYDIVSPDVANFDWVAEGC